MARTDSPDGCRGPCVYWSGEAPMARGRRIGTGRGQRAAGDGAIRHAYERHGVPAYYARFGTSYRNPHEPAIRAALAMAAGRWPLDLRRVLDLACGSGEATLALRKLGARAIVGADPYTGAAYRERTGQEALPLDFAAVAAGALAGECYTLAVCSFA